MSRVTSKNS